MKAVWLVVLLMGCSGDVVDCLGSEPGRHVDHDFNRCVVAGTQSQCDECASYDAECKIILDEDHRLASCDSSCASHAEAECIGSPGCRAVYVDGQFDHCWLTEPRPSKPKACAGLDADGCADRDDCTAFYTAKVGYSAFDSCAEEPAVSFLP